MLTIDLLRHGELEGGNRYRGRCDDQLTAEGRHAIDRVWHKIGDQVDRVICSPLQRCRLPAAEWAEASNSPLQVDQRLQELHYGAWEGKTMAEIALTHHDLLKQWRCDPTGMTPPEGESMERFEQRLREFWQQLINSSDNMRVLLLGHSGVNRTLLAIALQTTLASSRRLVMPYACWSQIQYINGSAQLAFHNRQP
ncbi:MAG: histidine phosphatase family protein [Mariprofundales bacterium]|nr:histidine phosphatase family protein [Mariprofundales bacterium]